MPGFPNMFTVLGTNSPHRLHSSVLGEVTAGYITRWLETFRDRAVDVIEVTEEAAARFTDDDAAALRPFDRATMADLLSEPEPRDFNIRRAQHIVNRRESMWALAR